MTFFWHDMFAFLSAFFVPLLFTPLLISLSLKKGYTATINHRTSHMKAVPNTGGIMLFIAVAGPLWIFSDYQNMPKLELFMAAFVILLITGIIDDSNPLPAGFKFLGQFIPAIVIVTNLDPGNLVIPFLQNVFDVPILFSELFWIIVIVFIINAFNLIDGIDGLAIVLGIFSAMIFACLFWSAHNTSLLTFAIILCGGLLGLLPYNLGKKRKIFIGDTGSLLIGGIISYFSLRFLCVQGACDAINSNITVVAGILFIPAADMLRVILGRMIKHQSPFRADRTHIHHLIMARFHTSHIATTLIVLLLNAIFFAVILGLTLHLTGTFLIVLLVLFLIYFLGIQWVFKTTG